MTSRSALPSWAELGLLPFLNLAAALLCAAIVIVVIGESPLHAGALLVAGALGSPEAIAFTLFYATSYLFTGLAVALPFHAGLFNIGGEGQAYVGGLGAALVCLGLDFAPPLVTIPLAVVASALFGAAWAFIPAWLQAYRGSHVVITTIMFNFLASALMTWLLVEVLIAPGQGAPETRVFDAVLSLPPLVPGTPLNLAFPLGLVCCALAWLLLWRTRWGYEIRATGLSETAARYGGVAVPRVVVLSLCLGGACAGLMAVNEVVGAQHRLLLDFPAGAGFVGIAVALMGRGHPLGILAAALLFGALAQGGAEIAFDMPKVQRELIMAIEGLVILFCGALEHLFRAPLERVLAR